jgi:hypothetical protein
MSSRIQIMLESIMQELAAGEKDPDELEAKAIFRLLNYCPPEDGVTQIEGNPVQKPTKPASDS